MKLILDSQQIRALAPMQEVIGCLRAAFQSNPAAPPRAIFKLPGGTDDRLLLSMLAFDREGGAVKLATVMPDNRLRGQPTIQGSIVLFAENGAPVALLDGALVTRIRTGAASALAADYLARADSDHLVIVGTGALAPMMALAHCTVRPIRKVSVVGRRPERVSATVAEIRSLVQSEVEVVGADSAESACASAAIVSCSTSSAEPVVRGRWLQPGTFIDLVGSFSPSKRESDDDVVRSSRIFVDTLDGALSEAGDILDPLQRGIIERSQIEGELADLVRGRVRGRLNRDERIVFKSVGSAIEDLAAARLIYRSV